MTLRIILFLLVNFGALAVGGLFTGKGVPSEWYAELAKAPWTPPGWVFGFAWTTIMICFSVYMALLWPVAEDKRMLTILYAGQWVLNVSWNPVFFYFHGIAAGLIIISLLAILVAFILSHYWSGLKGRSVLLLPYLIWLLIAVSLNGYIWYNN
jgi:tryptophan-rich sensory protein